MSNLDEGKQDVIDGIRGLAVLIVLLSHIGGFGFGILPGVNFQGIGKAGVYLFFVLSAWLLARLLLSSASSWRVGGYWLGYGVRRVFRIFPLYFSVLVYCYLAFKADLPYWVIPLDLGDIALHLALIDGRSVFWAIPVEFRFYIILPFIAVALRWFWKISQLLGIVVCLCLLLAPEFVPPDGVYETNTTNVWAYFSAFAVGLFIAFLQAELSFFLKSDWQRCIVQAAGWTSLFLIVLSIPSVASYLIILADIKSAPEPLASNFFHDWVFAYALLWGLFLMAVLSNRGVLSKAFENRALVWIGERSFSIYLTHIAVLRLVKDIGPDQPLIAGWLTVGLTLVVSQASFWSIERPGMKLGRTLSRRAQISRT